MSAMTENGLSRFNKLAALILLTLMPLAATNAGDGSVMLHKIKQINEACYSAYSSKFMSRFSKEGGYLETDLGEFEPTNTIELVDVFDEFLRPGSRLLDLGSGDGRVVFFASLFGVKATGIEYDQTLFRISMKARQKLKDVVPIDRVTIIRGDFLQHDFSGYDIFYLYLGTNNIVGLKVKLEREMKPGSLLIAYASNFGKALPRSLKLIKVYRNTPVKVYRSISRRKPH